ncbi:MAG: hypothetical protein H6817_07255 [Phycisphaerales bacterium]|nr:hypothetical protein [Phycisphaerales bacterium]
MRVPMLSLMTLLSFATLASGDADRWEITSQSRRVWTEISASAPGDFATDGGEHVADFGLFDKTVASNVAVSGPGDVTASASASANQTSILTTRKVVASGTAGGGSSSFGANTRTETDATSSLFVTFVLAEDAKLRLSGELLSDSFGQCNVNLTGPNFFSYTLVVQDDGAMQTVAEEWEITAGEYTFHIDAFADTETIGGGSQGQGAGFAIELSLVKCGDPNELELLEDVAFAVNSDNGNLYRSADAFTSLHWSQISALGDARCLAIHPLTGILYALLGEGDAQALVTVDPVTGEVVTTIDVTIDSIWPPTLLSGLLDIGFHADGTLYCTWIELFASSVIGTLDPETGVATAAGLPSSTDSPDVAITIDPATELLYRANGNSMVVTDLATGATSPVALSNPPTMSALAFPTNGGTMLAGTPEGETYIIDPPTGTSSIVPGVGLSGIAIDGLDILPALEIAGDPAVCVTVPGAHGDYDGNGVLSAADVAGLSDCLTGPGGGIATGACLAADVDEDGDADLADYEILMRNAGTGAAR